MDTQLPESPAGLSEQGPTALFGDMSRYFDEKHIIDGIMRSFKRQHIIDGIDDAFDTNAFADDMFRILARTLTGDTSPKQPAMEALTKYFNKQDIIDGTLRSFERDHITDGIGDTLDRDAFADDILQSLATTLTGDTFSKKTATEVSTTDSDAVLRVIATAWTESMFSKQPATEVPAIDQMTKESASTEIKDTAANLQPKLDMDATALHDQTLMNISVIDDLFMQYTPCKLSECKLITMHSDDEMFFAAVIRTLEELDPEGDARPITFIMAKYCGSSHEALTKLYEPSQCVLGRAYKLFEAQYSPLPPRLASPEGK